MNKLLIRQIKLFSYLEEYKRKIIRSQRSLVERVCVDTVIPDNAINNASLINSTSKIQPVVGAVTTTTAGGGVGGNQIMSSTNPTTKLWAEIRARGCQFLGPEMQDDVLRLIYLFLNTVTRISRKYLVTWIVWKLKNTYSKASRTSVGHVVSIK